MIQAYIGFHQPDKHETLLHLRWGCINAEEWLEKRILCWAGDITSVPFIWFMSSNLRLKWNLFKFISTNSSMGFRCFINLKAAWKASRIRNRTPADMFYCMGNGNGICSYIQMNMNANPIYVLIINDTPYLLELRTAPTKIIDSLVSRYHQWLYSWEIIKWPIQTIKKIS